MRKLIKKIEDFIKELKTYDRVYYDGRLTSLIIGIICFLICGFLMLLSILVGGV